MRAASTVEMLRSRKEIWKLDVAIDVFVLRSTRKMPELNNSNRVGVFVIFKRVCTYLARHSREHGFLNSCV